MGSRQKLNKLHLMGDVVLAGVFGAVVNSWLAFFVALAVLVGLDVHTGAVRPRIATRGMEKHRKRKEKT